MGDDSSSSSSSSRGEGQAQAVEAAEEAEIVQRVVYREKDLQGLIEKVKTFTTIYDVRDTDWSETVIEVITDYFEDSREQILCIYFDKCVLDASLGFPTVPTAEIAYFLKDPNVAIITPHNFHESVMFGTVNDVLEGILLPIVQCIYGPMFFNETPWPHNESYKLQGLTVMYVPAEGQDLSPEEASTNPELVKRLEGVCLHWTRQINIALGDKDQSNSKELLCPTDEHDFWVYRYHNLNVIDYQLQNQAIKHLCEILVMSQSTYIQQFLDVTKQIEAAKKEAKSNIEFLQILVDPCEDIGDLQSALEIPPAVPELLQLLRVIWLNAPYYNTIEKLTNLCKTISNLVILQCTKTVDLEFIFKGNTRAGIKLCEDCIDCCIQYKLLYDRVTDAHTTLSEVKWDLDKEVIFNHVDSFMQRCTDMIEICESMIIFGRKDETDQIDKPRFRGTRGEEFERAINRLEDEFNANLDSVYKIRDTILNVQASSWYRRILKYRKQMKELDVMVQNLSEAVFSQVSNVEEGLYAVQAFYHYAKRDAIRAEFNKMTIEVYKLFSDEIQAVKDDIMRVKKIHPTGLLKFSGRAMLLHLKRKRLAQLMKMLDDARWLPACGMGDDTRLQFQKVMRTINDTIKEYNWMWQDTLDENMDVRLDRSLLCHSPAKPGYMECNFDRTVMLACEEAKLWDRLKLEVPCQLHDLHSQWKTLKLLYHKVVQISMDYNYILDSLSSEERILFREVIRACDKKTAPGFSKLMWSSETLDQYINDCSDYISGVQEFIEDFKSANREIVLLCERICDTPMIAVAAGHVYSLAELDDCLEDFIEDTLDELQEIYEKIMIYMLVVHEGFAEHIEAMGVNWHKYVHKMDGVLEEALIQCVNTSLQVMREILHGEDISGPTPFIRICVTLKGTKVAFEPQIYEVGAVIEYTLQRLVEAIENFPRLFKKFNVPCMGKEGFSSAVETDPGCLEIQQEINAEFQTQVQHIQVYLQTWKPFKEMWELDKDMFVKRFEKLSPTVASFDANIARYTEVANNVHMIESIADVHFLIVDAAQLKQAITDHCNTWQNKLTDLMYRVTYQKIQDEYEYTQENGDLLRHVPQTLPELQEAIQHHDRMLKEVKGREKEFPIIKELFTVLHRPDCPAAALNWVWTSMLSIELLLKGQQVMEKYEYNCEPEMLSLLEGMDQDWINFLRLIDDVETRLTRDKERFRTGLLIERETFKHEASNLLTKFLSEGPFSSDWSTADALSNLRAIRAKLTELRGQEVILKENLAIFGISIPENVDLEKLDEELSSLELVWQLTDEWDRAWAMYKTGGFWQIETQEMEDTAQTLFRKLTRLSRELKDKNWSIVELTRSRVDAFRRTLPLIGDLKNPAMRDRHWERVKVAINRTFDQHSPDFTLDAIMSMNMQKYAEEIGDISKAATMELAIENGLKGIAETWKNMNLDMQPLRGGIYKIKVADELTQALEENQVAIGIMKSTKFVEPFIKEVDYWEKGLTATTEVLDIALVVQRQFLYLENIFHGEDIRRQMPEETTIFEEITSKWISITTRMNKDKNAFRATHVPNIWKDLNRLNDTLEAIQRALESYLETKRHIFPRFYFISNDDLLEVLAQSRRPQLVQPHLKKCFDNINRLNMQRNPANTKTEALGMYSADGEYIEFVGTILLEGPVELWLCTVESTMRATLKEQLKATLASLKMNLSRRDTWIKEWPGQMCITSSQIQWTSQCTRALIRCKIMEIRKPLKKLRRKEHQVLEKYSEAVRGTLTKIQRLKIVALVTIEIHARDVVENMYKQGVMDVMSFNWLSQLRFYWDKQKDDCVVKQTDTLFNYCYEYLGNSGRLVITPLTDRCYITLTMALNLHRGGSPKGPAGTGKTETVKDLGKALGSYVIVVNCSEGLDYKSMGRMFSGLSQTGAWGCFDEFNRINIEVLSVVAQQILCVLSALAANLERFVFDDVEINLKSTCGIFITMNPGYAGRTELPDNLKSMFRPISMIVPDSCLIAEIILFGEGFHNTRVLAKKVFTLYSLATQQLSKQDHYDFGLRALVSVLRYAGRIRREHPDLPDEKVALLAMRDMNIAKLTADDLPLFTGIIGDLFPGITVPEIQYEILGGAIRNYFDKSGLECTPAAYLKVIQLYETKNSRHSVMIVGVTGSGKSATWKTLQGAISDLAKKKVEGWNIVKEFPMNPKAVTLAELYGEFNLTTNEWLDGVLSSIMRNTCSDESPDHKWIIFDGPVDAVWIENMNSVMDDNKILTLINSERITMPDQVSLLFEVADLAVASPATVSRCGMVYNDYKDLGWKPYVNCWLKKQEDKGPTFVEQVGELFRRHVDAVLQFKHDNCHELITIPELNSVMSLCKLFDCLGTRENGLEPEDEEHFEGMVKMWFLFCLTWSICAAVDEEGRKKIDTFIREREGIYPLKETIYEYYVDIKSKSLMLWEGRLLDSWRYNKDDPFYKIIVPTVDTMRYEFLIAKLLENNYPGLLIGPVGTGKTSTAQTVLESLDEMKYSVLEIHMSAQTSSRNVQDAIEGRVEKRSKGIFGPPGGKTMISFMEDLNMPAKETFGAQPPLELVRQWIDYGFWYNREKQTRTYIKNMLVMGAMGPPGGGRTQISDRLLSRFNIINLTFPSEATITRIFATLLNIHLGRSLTAATIQLYFAVIANMLPTPTKMHYLFNLRDISKIFQGILRSHPDYQTTGTSMLRLWMHECYRVFNDRLIDDKDEDWFLNQMDATLGKFYDVTFRSLWPTNTVLIFGDFVNPYGMYEDLDDIAKLRKYLEEQMQEYNDSPGVVAMSLVLFTDAIQHITRIVRVVSQPRGNMLTIGIGGSGRQSLSRIASYICEYQVFQIEVKKNYGVPEFKEDLKVLYKLTGLELRPTAFVFSDVQVTTEAFLEIINNILSSGEVANLYKPEEFEEVRNALMKDMSKAGITSSNENVQHFLIERVRANLHVILCLSPIGDAFRDRIRQYPSFVNCTTIDWFKDWPKDALLEVAARYISDMDFMMTILPVPEEEQLRERDMAEKQAALRTSVAFMFATIHDSVAKYSKRMINEMRRYNYVTPTNYLELVKGYKDMLDEKRTHLYDAANKLRNGLDKIEDTKIKVQDMSVELAEAQVQVNQFQEECDKYLVNIVKQRMEADEQKAAVAAQSVTIKEEEVVCKKLADVALKDLEQAMPALEEAMKALEALNKKDLAEVKSYGRPPPKVELVMEAVMIFKQAEPTWAEAKRQLGDPNFLNNLKDFDRDHIPERVLRKIGTYTSNPEFDPEKVGTVSFAAKSLSMWVIAMEKYGIIYRIIAPKKEKLDVALATLKEKQDSLAAAQAQLKALSDYLEQLQKEYEEKLNQKEELKRKAELLALKLERAAQLVSGLSGERERWTQSVIDMNEEYWRLPGDCLLATGFVAYVGPFVSLYREELVDMWKKNVEEQEVPCSEDFVVSSFLCDPTTIREWSIQGLPSDAFSTENGIIVTRATRWPLLIDPQCQGMKWLKKYGKKMKLTVIDFGMPDYMKIMENAIQFGKAILLQNVSETLEPSLNPVLNKAIIHQGGQTLIKLTDKMVSYNEKFRLYITTKMSNPHYAPEITTKTTLVNFSVKEQGLEAQLLGIVVRKEKPQLEEQKDKLVLDIAASKRKLLNLEDELLRLLYETKGSLLDDLDLLITLQTSKETSVSVSVKLEVAEKTEKDIDHAREGYRPSARRASILFFVLNDMSQIDPMYQFSLDAYIILFTLSIEKSPRESELAERIVSLNNYHTYAVYRYSCRGLFENHKLLFSFHMCIKILSAIGKINETEYQFLLKGGVVLDKDTQLDNPCPEWLSEEAWDNITELDRIPGFHGVADTFEQFANEWHLWYINTNPEVLPLLGDWNKICTEFQKMLFVRCLRSDRLSFSVTNFIVSNLGSQFVEPPVLDIKAVLEDSTPQTPLIFVLSPGVDPTGALAQLAEAREMTKYYHSLSLGQGQAPVATRMIEIGAKEGNWVFLANCHLSLSWMPKLDKIVDNLQSSPVHKRFRLWLSSSPNPEFPISILQAGIKMTTEPPRGLKANLKRLYQGMTDTQFEACKNASAYKKLLFCLCFFHAVLLERRKFQQLGWNVVYSFNDSDFEISEQVLSNYLDEYEDSIPWAALKYLFASINYGGHVTDDWDRRLIETYVSQYFCEEALTTPNYRLSALPTYYVPKDGGLLSYLDHIQVLPTIDQAEAFGQHSNADITSLITETRVLCETLMSLQMQSAAGEGMSKEDKVLQLAAEVASRVPPPIDYAHTVKLIGDHRTPLDVVLLQEITRYNQLLTSMGTSLEELQKAIKGFVVMSSELEEIFTCMFEGRVPSAWLKAYSSLKLLGSWTRDLVLRVQHFFKWAETTHAPLYFWLSAFTFPTGFLTAVLQTEARRQGVSVDTLSWDFTVFTMEKPTLMVAPTEGVYVRGMFLEGAAWDRKNACLIEPQPMELVVSMPVIHFKPMEVLKKKMKGIYVCPCYYFPIRCGSQGRAAYIVAIDLKSGSETHEFWVKRGTAILLSLAN